MVLPASVGSIPVCGLKPLRPKGFRIRIFPPRLFFPAEAQTDRKGNALMSKPNGFLAEFKKFIARGNVLDLAVGVIIGGAFSAITNSLVNDIINPILGIFAGGNEALSGLSFQLPGGGALMLGNFINSVLNFLIMAFAVFCLVKAVNRLHRKKEETPPPPPQPSREEVLLTEIRDLLKERV